MPISFTIAKTQATLEQQWAYLLHRGEQNTLSVLKRFLLILLVATGLYFALYFFTSSNNFITFKVTSLFMIVLAWAVIIIRLLRFILGKWRNQRRLPELLNSYTEAELNYTVSITEEKITITSNENTHELPWKDFNEFGMHNETIYVFNHVQALNILFWNRNEMGNEAFTTLLEMLHQKKMKQIF
ncbi:hypothetical protein [Phnomibacter sp. MR]|uniref:hypothetical protein n=1 Tax=Phnomibacter sp. MR TaxID=3042318 RepID=UPI003A7FDF9E